MAGMYNSDDGSMMVDLSGHHAAAGGFSQAEDCRWKRKQPEFRGGNSGWSDWNLDELPQKDAKLAKGQKEGFATGGTKNTKADVGDEKGRVGKSITLG